MFKVLEPGARRRRVWTPSTVAFSVAAHLAIGVAVGVAYAGEPDPPAPPIEVIDGYIDITRPEPKPAPETPQPERPAPRSVPGRTIEMPSPSTVPTRIPEPDLTAAPITPDMVTGIGPVGNHIGPPTGEKPVTPGPIEPLGDGEPIDVSALEDRPEVVNRDEMARLLSRSYPPVLRDAGIAGRTVVELVILEDGTVDEGSIVIVESSHPSFAEPATRLARRMRFQPAAMMGQPVKVLISIPIQWNAPPRE
jgi:protein TonB